MSLEVVRRIRDNVHGTVDVTAVEDAVLCHPYVQRLRRIRQLAFLYQVFPGASHSRFEHSLGVMHLAATAWGKLESNQRRISESLGKYHDFAGLERQRVGPVSHGQLAPTLPLLSAIFGSDYHLQVLRLSGLLHDVGHPPFSHSGERFMPSWRDVLRANPEASDYLREYLQERIDTLAAKGKDPGKTAVRHEVYSLLMVDRILRDTYRSFPKLKLQIDPRDVAAVMTNSIEPARHSSIWQHGVYRLLHELISGELDIDRMDYLLRDSRECGVVYGIFDANRILDYLSLYYDEADRSVHVALQFSGLAAFEDYLRARHSMYQQVYFHKTAVAAEAMMQSLARDLGGWALPAKTEEYARVDEYNIGDRLLAAAAERGWDTATLARFKETLNALLYHRQLWKRVFELSGTYEHPPSAQMLGKARQLLSDSGYRYEEISSGSLLTRFRPRAADEPSLNYLRLIKKDEREFPRVVPIEDHSKLVGNNSSVVIHRLYVEDGEGKARQAVRQLLSEGI